MFHEFPKSLYLGGDPEKEHVIVQDEDGEAIARENGFKTAMEFYATEAQSEPETESGVTDDPAPEAPRRGRPPKAK